MSETLAPCPACGAPASDGALCQACVSAGDLLAADPSARMNALNQATDADRPRVIRAALRGGHLWQGPGPDGVDLDRQILWWLLDHDPDHAIARWLAEDARYGALAYAILARAEPTRTLQRAPVWLAPGREAADPDALVTGWARDRSHLAALGFRFGSTPLPRPEVDGMLAAMPWTFRPWVRFAVWSAHSYPTRGDWQVPTEVLEAARGWRRWPIEQVRPDGLACCSRCGEALPASGPCRFCGSDPKEPGGTLVLPTAQMLVGRTPCPTCGIDQCSFAVPGRCSGCGERITYSDLGMTEG